MLCAIDDFVKYIPMCPLQKGFFENKQMNNSKTEIVVKASRMKNTVGKLEISFIEYIAMKTVIQ